MSFPAFSTLRYAGDMLPGALALFRAHDGESFLGYWAANQAASSHHQAALETADGCVRRYAEANTVWVLFHLPEGNIDRLWETKDFGAYLNMLAAEAGPWLVHLDGEGACIGEYSATAEELSLAGLLPGHRKSEATRVASNTPYP